MDRRQHSFDTYALLQAAKTGDEEGVRKALQAGADVNAVDASGRTALTNAITGENWQIIRDSDASFMSEGRLNILRALVAHQDISLFTLNAPQEYMSGVCPLGMSAWLNMPLAVQVILEHSAGRLSVDGTDSLGATPLMYAARDGNLGVVQRLLDHGARPDLRDKNHRTAIQYSLRHSEILWMCETSLRQSRHPIHEATTYVKIVTNTDEKDLSQTAIPFPTLDASPVSLFPLFTRQETSRSTDIIVHTILALDPHKLKALLSSPPSLNRPQVLINKPDGNGWSPIHYCTASTRPSTEILDVLYIAGADMSLFTTSEQYTPLHCLAKGAHSATHALYLFTIHLVRDLRAPLGARDKNNETCIHIAAEHGDSIDILLALLECDKSGTVRNAHNSRGLTALEVAKPHLRVAFQAEARPESSLSMLTIRPSMSLTELTALSVPREARPSIDTVYSLPPSDFDVRSATKDLLDNLCIISKELSHYIHPSRLQELRNTLDETRQSSHNILVHFHTQVTEGRKDLADARALFSRVDGFWSGASNAAEERIGKFGGDNDNLMIELVRARKATRDSADSQATAFSIGSPTNSASTSDLKHYRESETYVRVAEYRDTSVNTEECVHPQVIAPQAIVAAARSTAHGWHEWLDGLLPHSEHTAGTDAHRKVTGYLTVPSHKEERRPVSPRRDIMHMWSGGRKKEDIDGGDRASPNGMGSYSGSRFKSWLKKKIVAHDHHHPKPQIVFDVDEDGCAVGREAKSDIEDTAVPHPPATQDDGDKQVLPVNPISRQHLLALVSSSRDLNNIEECLSAADHFLTSAHRSICRAERILQRALRSREVAIENQSARLYSYNLTVTGSTQLTLLTIPEPSSDNFGSTPPSSAVSSTFSSARSSRVSLIPSDSDESDDEDTRALRALLLHKIDNRLDASSDEIDKTNMWLRIVKDVVRGVNVKVCFGT